MTPEALALLFRRAVTAGNVPVTITADQAIAAARYLDPAGADDPDRSLYAHRPPAPVQKPEDPPLCWLCGRVCTAYPCPACGAPFRSDVCRSYVTPESLVPPVRYELVSTAGTRAVSEEEFMRNATAPEPPAPAPQAPPAPPEHPDWGKPRATSVKPSLPLPSALDGVFYQISEQIRTDSGVWHGNERGGTAGHMRGWVSNLLWHYIPPTSPKPPEYRLGQPARLMMAEDGVIVYEGPATPIADAMHR